MAASKPSNPVFGISEKITTSARVSRALEKRSPTNWEIHFRNRVKDLNPHHVMTYLIRWGIQTADIGIIIATHTLIEQATQAGISPLHSLKPHESI